MPFNYEIKLSQMGDNVGLIGATSLVFEETFLNTFEDLASEYVLK